jgi:hypothetical protein
MFNKMITVGHTALTVVLGSAALVSQQAPGAPSSSAGREFPVIMRQNVAAGKTLVGTKVQAKLVVATLVNGAVVPRDAILSGEVTESVAKSVSDPSRLAIRMDSAQWKNGSAPIKVYLTAWFYPVAAMAPQDLSYEPPDAAKSPKNWNGAGTYPDPNNPVSQQKFPGRDTDKDASLAPPSPASSISNHRVLMKNVESTRNSDGAVALTSTHLNVKLDRFTTYVFAAGNLLPMN